MPDTDTPRWTEYLPVADLQPAIRNAKAHDQVALGASVGAFGMLEPVVMDERTGRLLAGHGRTDHLTALEAAGAEPPDGVVVGPDGRWQWLVVRGISSTDDLHAEAMGVALNRVGERGGWQTDVLAATMDDLASTNWADAIGWTGDELDDLIAQSTPPMEPSTPTEWPFHVPVPPPAGDEAATIAAMLDAAVAYYREQGFPYPSQSLPERLLDVYRLARTPTAALLHTTTADQVANNYHPQRYTVVCAGAPGSVLDAYASDKLLRHAITLAYEQNASLSPGAVRAKLAIVRGHQAAANFRPGYALLAYRTWCPPGGTVLDTSAGYGGRLVGFAASHVGRYVGIDPSTAAIEGNRQLASDLGVADRADLIHKPAEDVDPSEIGQVDLAFTSPPYFAKERYTDEATQSWKRYGTAEAWRDDFLRPLMALQATALRPSGHAVVNIADVRVGGVVHPLVEWTITAAEQAGLTHVLTTMYPLARVPGAGDRPDRGEPTLVFRKL